MIGPLVDLAKKYKVDPDKMTLESISAPLNNVPPHILKDGNVLGTLIFPAQTYETNPDIAHACVLIGIEQTRIPIAGGGQQATRQFVIKNSYNTEQISRRGLAIKKIL